MPHQKQPAQRDAFVLQPIHCRARAGRLRGTARFDNPPQSYTLYRNLGSTTIDPLA